MTHRNRPDIDQQWKVDREMEEFAQSPLDEILAELANEEPSDPFEAQSEVVSLQYLMRVARQLAEQDQAANARTDPSAEAALFSQLIQRRDGIRGLTRLVSARLEAFGSLVPRSEPSPPHAAKTKKLVELMRLLALSRDFLERLELACGGPEQERVLAAQLGAAIAIGMELGRQATLLVHHQALERDAATQAGRAIGGNRTSWMNSHPREGAIIVSDALRRFLADSPPTLEAAIKAAGVGHAEIKIDIPNPTTVRRMFNRETNSLLGEISDHLKAGRSRQEACACVAESRKPRGFELTGDLLERLIDRHEQTQRLRDNPDLIAQLMSPQAVAALNEFLRATNAEQDVLAAALAAISDE